MCIPVVLLGVWTLTRGGGAGPLLGGLVCMVAMFVMHGALGGHGRHHH